MITTTSSGTASITIKSAAPEVKSAAINRGIDRTSHKAI
jgi:hypothetical protein